MFDDTTPEARAVQMRLLREAGPERRLALAMRLTDTVRDLARESIRRQRPGWSELEVNLALAERCYGRELMEKVRAYLAEKDA